ncbi:MAG: alpha/beta hydrolase [Cyanobacteria bacterium CRU_2_1]|nr:alpha/beta hydrolase [Cyanobacteria bacterium RU_5_0]NJR58566.1 alpha/beta hydrolase [Cyanobacteria bacterium CRU_2_1]
MNLPTSIRRVLFLTIGTGLTVAASLWSATAIAAEQVVMKYQIFERSVSVADLTTFAETGEASSELENYMEASGQDPELIRRMLTREVEIGVVPLDRMLNNAVGDVMLDQVSEFVYTPSGAADREAMRSALVLSASDDDHVSLIEIIQKYPTQQVYVDGNRINAAYRQIENLRENVGGVLDTLESIGF